MDYQISESIAKKLQTLTAMPAVQRALAYLEADNASSVEEQIAFTLTEAPTFHEEARAALYASKLAALGVADIATDPSNTVAGMLRGTEDGTVSIEAHLDTVFPFGTTKEVRREGDTLYAPGIYDNARGIACLLAFLRALRLSGIKTRKSLLVAGTSREESTGALGGMRDLIDSHPDLLANVSVDGGYMERITFNATFNTIVEYTFTGKGGHAFSAFGTIANPLGAAARAIALMQELAVPNKPKTTFAATKLTTPAYSGVTSFPDSCTLCINYRSDSQEAYETLGAEIDACVAKACEAELARWGTQDIGVEKKILGHLPGGRQSAHAPIVEAYYACADYIGAKPEFSDSGNTNSNIPISRGIPSVTVGSSRNRALGAHSLGEHFCTTEAYKCPQGLFLLMLLLLGVENGIESCLD